MDKHKEEKHAVLSKKMKGRLYPVVLEQFSKMDFHRVNIREISKLSGVSTTTIYRYFPSKENLLFTILDESLRDLVSLIRMHLQGLESTKEMFRKLFWVTLDHYDRIPGLAIASIVTVPTHSWMGEESYKRKDGYELINQIIQYGRDCGEIDSEVSNEQIIDLYFMYCHRQILRWCFHQKTKNLTDSIGQFFDVFWKTVSTPK